MFSSKILKVLFVPAATVITEVKDSIPKGDIKKIRPSELPIYPNKTESKSQPVEEEKEPPPKMLIDIISKTRQSVTAVGTEIKNLQRIGRDNSEWLINTLQEKDNVTPKAGAIAIGALTGLIFGLRGGRFKRLIYTSTGALGMAAICYPKEAAQYSEVLGVYTRKYATISYNFVRGVKKGDPPLELPSLPKLPSNVSEAWDSVVKTTSNLVSSNETEQQKKKPKE